MIYLAQWDTSSRELQVIKFKTPTAADIYDKVCNQDGEWKEQSVGSEQDNTVMIRSCSHKVSDDVAISVIAPSRQTALDVMEMEIADHED